MPTNRDANEMDHIPADDQEFEELAIAEEELIDAYVRDELSVDERKLVEKGLRSSPRLVERFQFARMLAQEISAVTQQQTSSSLGESEASVDQSDPERIRTPWWKSFFGASFVPQSAFRLALGACVVVVVLSGVALFAGWMKLRSESRRLASERNAIEQQRQGFEKQSAEQRSSTNQLNADLQAARKQVEELTEAQKRNEQSQPPIISTIVSAFLFPGSTRGTGGGNEVFVSPDGATVSLKLVLESNEYPRYRAIIRNSRNVEILRDGLKPRSTRYGKAIFLQLPATLLPPGDYTVRVSGVTSGAVEPVADYPLRVTAIQK